MRIHNIKSYFKRRKELRKNLTPQEEKLWQALRNNKLGVRFRRQHSIGGYILDFYCFQKRLIVEVDGVSHKENKEYDAIRDTYFSDLGYVTIRVTNKEVDSSLEGVLEKIKEGLRA